MPDNDEQSFRKMMDDRIALLRRNRIAAQAFIVAGLLLIVALVACGVW